MRGVQTGPGAITLTRIFFSASSAERPFVKVTMAPCTKLVSACPAAEASSYLQTLLKPHTLPAGRGCGWEQLH